MLTDRYESINKRTFRQAIVQLLESEYKILGSHRLLQMLAEDIEQLHKQYYPDTLKMEPGVICWRSQELGDGKLHYGKRTEQYKSKTIYLPLITCEDVDKRTVHKKGIRNDNYQRSDERELATMERIVWSAYDQGCPLTGSELSVLLNRSLSTIGKYIKKYYAENKDKTLPLRGYIIDSGSNPTHKGLICTLYERGVSEADIVLKTGHSIRSVSRYIKAYERVKLLLKKAMKTEEISRIVNIGQRVVKEYERIAFHFHPELENFRKKKSSRKT